MVNISNNAISNVRISNPPNNKINSRTETNSSVNSSTNGDAQLARSWAIGEGLIDGEDYSAKHYAQVAEGYIRDVVEGITGEGNVIVDKTNGIVISTKHYEHTQAVASDSWVIDHNLDKPCPKVTIIDSAGTVFYPAVKYINNNRCIVPLIGAMTGTAYLE